MPLNRQRLVSRSQGPDALRYTRAVAVATLANFLLILSQNGDARPSPSAAKTPTVAAAAPTYADLADRFAAAPIVAQVKVRKRQVIRGTPATGQSGGTLVTGEITALIKSPAALPPKVQYLGAAPHPGVRPLKGSVWIAARPVLAQNGSTGAVQLLTGQSEIAASPDVDSRLRDLVRAFSAPGAPGAVTGISSAHFSPGALADEGRTQIFLSSANGRPVSLVIMRGAGGGRRWTAALDDDVSDETPPPATDTPGWYRLACGLPATLPEPVLAELDEQGRAAVVDDYRYVLDRLGPCTRILPPVPSS